jgi:hypothetical protein
VAQLEAEAPTAALTAEHFEEFFSAGDVLAQATPWERTYLESLHGLLTRRRPALAVPYQERVAA